MLGRFKGEVISAGIRTYTQKETGNVMPQFVVKIKCHPAQDQKDDQGKPVSAFIREWTGTYVEGDNRMYTDNALQLMGYLYTTEDFSEFDDLVNSWFKDAEFEVLVDEREGKDQGGAPKMFEYIKSIWPRVSTEIKNAVDKSSIASVMKGLSLPEGHAANMRANMKAKLGDKIAAAKASPAAQANNSSHAADDIPF